MRINCDYNHKKEEFYNKVNKLFDNLELIDGGKFSRNLNEAKNRVDFIYSPYNLQGNVQLQENKVIIEGKIPPYVSHKDIPLIGKIMNRLTGHDPIKCTKSINNSKENTEKNLEDAIMGESERIFN